MAKQRTNVVNRVLIPSYMLLLLALTAVLGACGGGSGTADSLDESSNDTSSSSPIIAAGGTYPGIPADNSGVATRGASAVETIPGSDALMISNGEVVGTSLILASTADELAWGLYRIEGLAGRKIDSLTIMAVPGGPDQIYSVGVSNFSDGVWEFLETATLPENEYDLTGEQIRLVSSLGNLYFIVVASGGDSVTVEQATISSEVDDSNDLPPALGNRPQVSEGLSDRIVITWSPIDGAESYELWRALDTDSMDEEFSLLASTTETSYTDTSIMLDTEYSYKVRGVSAAGYGNFSDDASGWAGTTPPEGEDEDHDGTRKEAFGAIEAISGASLTVDGTEFNIEEDTQWLDDNNLPVDPNYFVAGLTVEVHAKADDTGGWIATRVNMEDVHEGQEDEDEGTIESINESQFVVDGATYLITSYTQWFDSDDNPLTQADFAAGDSVKVEAQLDSSGGWIALKVEKEDEGGGGGGDGESIEAEGAIQALTASTLTVAGTAFNYDSYTEWHDGDNDPLTPDDFQVGDYVKVDGVSDGESGNYAEEVELDD